MSSLQALSLSSRRAEDAAATFLLFRDALPAGQEAHVPALVGAHYNLQTALLDLKRTLSDARFAPFADVVARDQRSVLQSIEHTLRDIRRLFAGLAEHDDDIDLDGGGIRGGAGAGSGRGYSRERTHPINGAGAGAGGREAYRRVWRRIGEHFAAEGHGIAGCDSLVARLQCYEAFVRDLIGCVEGRRPGRAFANLQYKVEKLLGRQSKSLEASMDMLAVGRAPTAKQRSWERMRPGRVGGGGRVEGRTEDEFADYELCDDEDGVYSDEYAGGAGAGRAGGRVAVPTEFALDPRLRPDVITPAALGHATYAAGPSYRPAPGLRYSPESGAGLAYDQQFAPDPPGSPGGSTATASSLSSDGGSRDRDADHWVASVFAQARPATAFASTGSESACYGEHMPAAARRLRDGYDQLVRLPFDDGQIEARVLVRHADRRARILVRCERGARRLLSCQPLTSLRVLRRGDGLQLCVPERAHVVLWALLRFPTFERLVLFWCTFQALKAQDMANPITGLDDPNLDSEQRLFSAIIIDDSYQHALHILRDKDTRVVRLQACALTGPMKRTPIWTAFITNSIASAAWQTKFEAKKVHLQDLTRFVFTDDYVPQLGPREEHELFFARSQDADLFMETIDGIAEEKI